ncbi:DUF6541 family protein [Microbacterium sp. GXF6406]
MIAAWAEQAPALIVALAVLILPGLPAAFAFRLRGVLRLGLAVALSTAIVAVATVLAPLIGLAWSWVPIAITAIIVTGIAFSVRFLGGRDEGIPAQGSRSWPVWTTTIVAGVLWAIVLVLGIVDPAHPSQLFDALFHLNAVEFIEQTGDASPLHMTMVVPGAASSLYPTLWHAIVSLVVPAAGGSIVAATNVVTIAAIGLLWPVSLVSFTTVLFPKQPKAAAWAPLVAFGFSVFPLGFLNWGVLYPNLLGTLLLPLFLALVILAAEPRIPSRERILRVLAAFAAVAATAAAHPSALLAGLALLVPYALWRIKRLAAQLSPAKQTLTWGLTAVGLLAFAVIWYKMNVTTNEWLPSMTFGQAAGEALFLSPVGRATGFLLGPLAMIGMVYVVRARRWWILAMYAVSVGFFLVSAWLPALGIRSFFVGVWYDDTTRVGALLAILGLPLAALGAAMVAGWIQSLWSRKRSSRVISMVMCVVVAALGSTHLVAMLNDLRFMRNVSFRFSVDSQGLSPEEAELFGRMEEILNEDALVIGDPLTGAGLLYAYTGHDVVFPHVNGRYGEDAALLARELSVGGYAMCDAIGRLGVTHAVDLGDRVLFENHYSTYSGLHGLDTSTVLMEIERVGEATLYEVTGCD